MTEAYIKLAKSYPGQLGYVNYMNKLSLLKAISGHKEDTSDPGSSMFISSML